MAKKRRAKRGGKRPIELLNRQLRKLNNIVKKRPGGKPLA